MKYHVMENYKKSKFILLIMVVLCINFLLVACSDDKTTQEQMNLTQENTIISPTIEVTKNVSTNETEVTVPEHFLNSVDGVNFQRYAYNYAKLFLSGNLQKEAKNILDTKNTLIETENIFNDVDYIILNWDKSDYISENEITASYQYQLKGDNTICYINMTLLKEDNVWKLKQIKTEKRIYNSTEDFLNSSEGIEFKKFAYKCTKAFLSGDLKNISEDFVDPENANMITSDIFDDIEYMILKWELSDYKSENQISVSYEYKAPSWDTVSYVTAEFSKVNGEWKVNWINSEQ